MFNKYKPYNKEMDYSYCIGIYPTLQLLKYRKEYIVKIYITSNSYISKNVNKIIDICNKNNIDYEINDKLISRIVKSNNHHVLAVFKKYNSNIDNNTNHIVLVSPDDMGNLGTIIRTMISFNVSNLVIIKPSIDIYNPKVIRASMGEIFQMNFSYFNNFDDYYKGINNNIYTFMLNSKNLLSNIKFNKPFSLVFGNEGSGLDNSYSNIGLSVKIPQSNNTDSLNLSVSVGIALYKSFIG